MAELNFSLKTAERTTSKLLGRLISMAIVGWAVGCGGGGASPRPAPTPAVTPPPPLPPPPAIVTTSIPGANYLEFYETKFEASGGSGSLTWSVVSLPQGFALNPGTGKVNGFVELAFSPLTFDVKVTDDAGRFDLKHFQTIVDFPPAKIITAGLPNGVAGKFYTEGILVNRPPGINGEFKIISGSLPSGLRLDNGSFSTRVFGTPTQTGMSSFTLRWRELDPGTAVAQQAFTLTIGNAGSRNETKDTATRVFNGTWLGSISPFAESSPIAAPDQDFYQVKSAGGSVVRFNVHAQRDGVLHPVVELVDSNGDRLSGCALQGQTEFDSDCLSDDGGLDGISAVLTLKVPGTSAATEIFVHVLDFRGDARPDMDYALGVLGAN